MEKMSTCLCFNFYTTLSLNMAGLVWFGFLLYPSLLFVNIHSNARNFIFLTINEKHGDFKL